MCLVSKHCIPRLAKKDITCYKVLQISSILKGKIKIVTPVMREEIPTNQILNTDEKLQYVLRSPIFPLFGKKAYEHVYEVGKGYIHTYANPEMRDDLIVCKCIIPKGTLYFSSTNKREYASKKIKFIKFFNHGWVIKKQKDTVKIQNKYYPLLAGSYKIKE